MPTATTAPRPIAAAGAERNWAANRAALRATQPAVAAALDVVDPDVEWTLGRDGSLTARLEGGRWWAGCSVPDRAGRALMAGVEPSPAVHCLVAPEHAGILAAVVDRLGPRTPVVVVQPDARSARVLLGSADVSAAVAGHRLWLATGDGWSDELASLLAAYPGLAAPTRFTRSGLAADEVVASILATAQRVIEAAAADRVGRLAALRATWPTRPAGGPPVVFCRSGYDLWDDGPGRLSAAVAAVAPGAVRFDTDAPLNTSPVALATVGAACGGVVAANVGRADAAGLVRADVPWVTWATRPAVPAFTGAGPRDAVVLVDAGWRPLAAAAGWPAGRVHVCPWPDAGVGAATAPGHLAVVADTTDVVMPAAVADFSSHASLWEAIAAELRADPLAGRDAAAFLVDRCRRARVELATLDAAAFADGLIGPAYAQGVARTLIAAALPVRLHGRGWSDLPEFAPHAAGPVTTVAGRDAAVAAAAGLVHVWPEAAPHPIDSLGRQVVRPRSADAAAFVAAARRATPGGGVPAAANHDALTATVRRLLAA